MRRSPIRCSRKRISQVWLTASKLVLGQAKPDPGERPDIGLQDVVHLGAADPDHERVQRIVLAAPRPEPVREPEEVILVDRVQQRGRRSLDDLVLEGGHRERALVAIRLRDVPPSRRQRPVRSPMDPCMQVLDPMVEVRGIGPPCQPVHARGGLPPESEERRPQHLRADMVEERGEPFLPSVPCGLPYALQHLGHACRVLRPARALLARIPLGLRPSLHRLRNRSPGVVRRLPRYYGGV
jgi:hypothetical protein